MTARQAKRARQREARQRHKAAREGLTGQQIVPTSPDVDLRLMGALRDDVMARVTSDWIATRGGSGSDDLVAHAKHYRPAVRLEDGSVGWCMSPARLDDCLRPSIATVLQVSPAQIPDPRLDERLEAGESASEINRETWERLDRWLAGRGLRLVFHRNALPVERDRWIGVVAGTPLADDPVAFQDHCLVMNGRSVLLNPIVSIPTPPGMRARRRRCLRSRDPARAHAGRHRVLPLAAPAHGALPPTRPGPGRRADQPRCPGTAAQGDRGMTGHRTAGGEGRHPKPNHARTAGWVRSDGRRARVARGEGETR